MSSRIPLKRIEEASFCIGRKYRFCRARDITSEKEKLLLLVKLNLMLQACYKPFRATSRMRFSDIRFADGRKPQRFLSRGDFISCDLM